MTDRDKEAARLIRLGRKEINSGPYAYRVVDEVLNTRRVAKVHIATGRIAYLHIDDTFTMRENRIPDDCNPWAKEV